jgi:hypothetical protein
MARRLDGKSLAEGTTMKRCAGSPRTMKEKDEEEGNGAPE